MVGFHTNLFLIHDEISISPPSHSNRFCDVNYNLFERRGGLLLKTKVRRVLIIILTANQRFHNDAFTLEKSPSSE